MIHQLAENESQQRSFYRILQNQRMEIEELKAYICSDCYRQVESGSHYLVIQDTTQPNFDRNKANIRDRTGLGVIADRSSLGFFLHASLVVEANSGQSIGFSDIQTWSREMAMPTKTERNYKSLPIEQKESMRWLRATQQSVEGLKSASKVTIIADREGDISELFERRGKADLLIRSRDNRLLSEGKLYDYLSSQPPAGSFELALKGDARKETQSRVAQIEVRFVKVHLTPKSLKDKRIEVYALEARETNPPTPQQAILWRLLTTHPIESLQQACQIIDWYHSRWNIEQVFRLIKHKGLNVEGSDLETGKALIVMTLMALFAASKVMLLHIASKQEEPQPIAKTFTEDQIACLKVLNQKYEGNTQRQKNNYPHDSLQWCYWVIGRMGGWKPQEKQAGVISLFRGYQQFYNIYQGWLLAKQFVS